MKIRSAILISALPILFASAIPAWAVPAGTPALSVRDAAAKANGTTPKTSAPTTVDHTDTNQMTVDAVTGDCTAANKNYGEVYASMFDKGPSIMSQCGLGKLIDFDLLELFDPMGALLDAMQGAVCGWVNEAYTPFQKSWNSKASQANQWVNSRNRGYSNWVDDRASAVYDTLYGAYKNKQASGLSDIGYPYETQFTDSTTAPVGSNTSGSGSNGGTNSGSGSNLNGGSLNTGGANGDVIIINTGSGPVVTDSSSSSNTSSNSQEAGRTMRNYVPADDEGDGGNAEDLSEIYRIFRK